jgi:SAM-dependent methyltransferase
MATKESQSQHWAEKKRNVIQSYWDSPPATKRSKWFVEQLKNYEFDSIFEVGFFAGRNLRYIGEAFPDIAIGGIEINPRAAKFAKEKLAQPNLICGNLHDLDTIHDDYRDAFDVVFTSGVLIHVPPDEVSNAVHKMSRKATKYIMHIESLGNNEVTAGPKHLKPTYKVSDQIQWAPDLLGVYRDIGYEPKVISLPDDCKTNGASELIVVKIT